MVDGDPPIERLTTVIQDIDTILKALANRLIRASMRANADASRMGSLDTSSYELVGESAVLSTEILENFITTHGQFHLWGTGYN